MLKPDLETITEPNLTRSAQAPHSSDEYRSRITARRACIGLAAGLAAGVILACAMHAVSLGLGCGAVAGVIYALLAGPARNRTVEEVFTVAALSFPVWAIVNCILLPILSGHGPAWAVVEMRSLLPALAGWILYGVLLVPLTRVGESAAGVLLGPEPAAPTHAALQLRRIVILGGGFAGMTTAENLEREFGADRSVSFTLVSENNALLFTPMLAEVAGSSLEPSHISSPLRTALHRTNVVRARVTGVDFEHRCVRTDSASNGVPREIPYDHLVFALGSRSNYFGNDSVRQNSFDFKSLLDAIRIRNHVIEMFERADGEPSESVRRELLTFVIAGGGFAGVELAGALNDFARGVLADYPHLHPEDVNVTLVHPRSVILPELSESLGEYARGHMEIRGVHFELGRRVLDAKGGVVVLDNREIPTRTLVWTAGTAPNPLLKQVGLDTDKRGAVLVDASLAVSGRPNLWALGDCAAVVNAKSGKPCPPTAQFALREGRVLARNIKAVVEGRKPDPFHFDALGALCVVGHHTACAELNLPWPVKKTVRFSGLLAWFMWRGIYVSKLPGVERKVRVLIDWTVELFFPKDIVQTIDLK